LGLKSPEHWGYGDSAPVRDNYDGANRLVAVRKNGAITGHGVLANIAYGSLDERAA
jgi:hypothetical protein